MCLMWLVYSHYSHLRNRAIYWGVLPSIRNNFKAVEDAREEAIKVVDRALLEPTPEKRAERLRAAGVTEENVINGLIYYRAEGQNEFSAPEG